MKKQPKTVYIIENGKYTELTYEEFRHREQTCPLYADRLFLPLYGRLMEVSKKDYEEFYRARRRQKYIDERSAENGDFSYDILTTDDFNGEDILIDTSQDIGDAVIHKIMLDKLSSSIILLSDDEQKLIREIFYEGLSERKLAEKYGVSQVAIHKRKNKILDKLKKIIEK